MGRQQYLTRLALGRSAFQEPTPPAQPAEPTLESNTDTDSPSSPPNTQQYDNKGRPFNPATDARNAALRKAQNDVLAAVGVCERRDAASSSARHGESMARERSSELRQREEEWVEDVELGVRLVRLFAVWWPVCLQQRFQVGLYGQDTTFASVVAFERRRLLWTGFRTLPCLLPGFCSYTLYYVTKNGLDLLNEEAIDSLQQRVLKADLGRATTRRLHAGLEILNNILSFSIEVALLPLSIFARLQCLGFAPATKLLPPLHSFLPTSASSPIRAGLISHFNPTQTIATRLLAVLSSPVTIFLASQLIHENAETPLRHFTGFTSPDITLPLTPSTGTHGPFGAILNAALRTRDMLLANLGWTASLPALQEKETTIALRTPLLAATPARFLATRIDALMERLVALPFERLVLRSVAGVLGNSLVVSGTEHLYKPFGDGPLSRLWAFGGQKQQLHAVGAYMGRLGLGLAVQAAMESVLFFGLYAVVRSSGIISFGWQRRRKDRDEHDERQVLE